MGIILPAFFGDCVFTTASTETITITDGTGDDTVEIEVESGMWFANALVLGRWLEGQYNDNAARNTIDISVVMADGANQGKTKFSFDGGATLTTLFSSNMQAYLGVGAEAAAEGGPDWYTDDQVSHCWFCTWPVSQYDREVVSLGGYSAASQDGKVYSIRGQHQEARTMTVNIDRRTDFSEHSLWLALWNNRWQQGRAVTFYPDRGKADDGTTADQVIEGDVLEAMDIDTLPILRSVRESDAASEGGPHTFRVRQPIPHNTTSPARWSVGDYVFFVGKMGA